MANMLDEMSNETLPEGREINVINKRVPVTVGTGSKVFEILLWVCGILPGIIFAVMKTKARDYFQSLEQKLQHNASQIDNFLEQRVVILQDVAKLVNMSLEHEKDTLTQIARYRSGAVDADAARNEVANQVEDLSRNINVAIESYPDLQAREQINAAMRQNYQLQREITAARELYNDTVLTWNREIFQWPTKRIVAAKNGYTTRIPFATSAAIKERATQSFF